MIKELEYLKDENRHLRTHVTKLEEKVTLLTKEKEDQERSFVEEKMKKEKEIVQKAIELADKSGDYINLLNKMEQMKNERDEAQKQAEELRQQPKTQVHCKTLTTDLFLVQCDLGKEFPSNHITALNYYNHSLLSLNISYCWIPDLENQELWVKKLFNGMPIL